MKKAHLATFLAVFAILFASVNSQLVRMPLNKKQKSHALNQFTNFNSQNGSIPIQNMANTQYYATFQIGSSGQSFNLVLDTGSGILWVPDSSLSGKYGNTFNCQKSSSCVANPLETFNLTYLSGNIDGYEITDQVNIGGMTLQNFDMMLATSVGSLPLGTFDGIIGLGTSSLMGFNTVLDSMKSSGLISEGVFSMYLGDESDADGQNTGEIIFGGYDPKYAAGDFQFINLTASDAGYWMANLDAVGLGNTTNISSGTSGSVVFDSGTSLIMLPQSFIDNIIQQASNQSITCTLDTTQNLYECDCDIQDTLGDLIFYFDQNSFNIDVSSYIRTINGNCYLAIQPVAGDVSDSNPMILGDAFLNSYYALYTMDNSTIGLALAMPVTSSPVWIYFLGAFGAVALGILIYACWKSKKGDNTESSGYQAFKGKGVALGGGSGSNKKKTQVINDQSSDSQQGGVVIGGGERTGARRYYYPKDLQEE